MKRHTRFLIPAAVAFAAVAVACSGGSDREGAGGGDGLTASPTATDTPPIPEPTVRPGEARSFPAAPDVPTGSLANATSTALDGLVDDMVGTLLSGEVVFDADNYAAVADAGDARVAWLLADYMRFLPADFHSDAMVRTFARLTGAEIGAANRWRSMLDHLIAWDLPAYPGYADDKAALLELVEPRWSPFFDDEDANLDWRLVSWGGVLVDDRPYGDPNPCELGCIPALDAPAVTDATGGDWYPDDGIVFGVVIDGEARAYPKNVMEVHEMVNDTLADRRFALPYCTLCGSAQAYFVDDLPDDVETPVLRTSGLLIRSNKMTYDLVSSSLIDTFTGLAVSGPLRERGVELTQMTVFTSTWADWKAAHPGTTIVAEDGGIGRTYPDDPLRGRDDDGPIFPIGDVDARLGVQEKVLGVTAPDGTPVAFAVEATGDTLAAGGDVELAGVRVVSDGAGLAAETPDGEPLVAHEAFWFAWSQFMTDTLVWPLDG